MNKRTIILVTFYLLSALHPMLVAAEDASNTLRIGAALPLTGDFAFVGKELQRGMELAREKDSNVNVEIKYEDDQSLKSLAVVTAANKLIRVDNVDAMLSASVDNMAALAPILDSSKTPGVIVWDNTQAVEKLSPYLFAMGYSADLSGHDMARFATGTLSAKRAAVVSAEGEWSERITAAFTEAFGAFDGTIALHDRVNSKNTDFRSLILRIRAAKIDVVYAPLYYASMTSFVRQARGLGLQVPILTADGFTVGDAEILAGTKNLYLTHLWLNDKMFENEYQTRFGTIKSPLHLAYAALGYDAVSSLIKHAELLRSDGEKISRANLHKSLKSAPYFGIGGTTDFRTRQTAEKHPVILKLTDAGLAPWHSREKQRTRYK